MVLSEKDREIFFDNYLPILFYAAVYEGLMPQNSRLPDFKDVSLDTKARSRNVLFTDKEVLKYFLSDNKHLLDKRAVEFISEISRGLLSDFIVLKQEKEFAVLMELGTSNFYEVTNITDSFVDMLPDLPVKAKTAIFNFNGKIICDGLIVGGNVLIGPGITSTLLQDYKEAIKARKVINLIK